MQVKGDQNTKKKFKKQHKDQEEEAPNNSDPADIDNNWSFLSDMEKEFSASQNPQNCTTDSFMVSPGQTLITHYFTKC